MSKTIKFEEAKILIKTFQEASKITFSLVFLPTILLLFAIFLDKKYHTTPFFIISGIISGTIIGICKAINFKAKKRDKI